MDQSKVKHHHRSSSQSAGPIAHSTPSKSCSKMLKFSDQPPEVSGGHDMPDGAASIPSTRFVFRRDLASTSTNDSHSNMLTEMERDTIIKQRTELQLLIAELRDRDKELNEMVQAHRMEMKAWQEDRNLTQSLDQKCAKLERDLSKRNNQIRELLKKMKAIEGEALDSSSALENSRHQLFNLEEVHRSVCEQLRELEDYSSKLQESFKQTSQGLGEAEGKIVQLQQHIQVKEKEAVATNKEVTDLASRLQSLEFSYKQLEKITLDVKTSANEWKTKYMETKQYSDGLKSELDISNAALDEKTDELKKARQLLKEKQDELAYTIEREKRKDQMLALQKSKQERTDTELSTLRQMYDLQQHKLAATRKELTEVKEKDIKYKCNFHHDDSSMFDITNGSVTSSPSRSPRRGAHYSPSRLHTSPEGHRLTNGEDVVTLDRHRDSGVSSTDRLQKLLSDSKRLVDTITSNESKSPTHLMAQLSASNDDR